jgi:hypothetical protein
VGDGAEEQDARQREGGLRTGDAEQDDEGGFGRAETARPGDDAARRGGEHVDGDQDPDLPGCGRARNGQHAEREGHPHDQRRGCRCGHHDQQVAGTPHELRARREGVPKPVAQEPCRYGGGERDERDDDGQRARQSAKVGTELRQQDTASGGQRDGDDDREEQQVRDRATDLEETRHGH